MSYQIWFSVNVEPAIPKDYLEQRNYLAPNWFYPVGSIVDGRMLCRCLTDDFETIRNELEVFNKGVIVCGARLQNGDWLEQYQKNQTEFDKFMQQYEIEFGEETITVIPADNTTAGWPAFNDVVS